MSAREELINLAGYRYTPEKYVRKGQELYDRIAAEVRTATIKKIATAIRDQSRPEERTPDLCRIWDAMRSLEETVATRTRHLVYEEGRASSTLANVADRLENVAAQRESGTGVEYRTTYRAVAKDVRRMAEEA